MDHVAIMRKSWGLIPKILNGEKTIESRWYKARYAPWNRVKKGDTIYFKNSGEPVNVRAKVTKVIQYHLRHPERAKRVEGSRNRLTVKQILEKYGKADGLGVNDIPKFYKLFKDKKYCILIFLSDPKKVKPFNIDKTGFGAMSAWISVENIYLIKVPFRS